MDILVTCAPGLGGLLAQEVEACLGRECHLTQAALATSESVSLSLGVNPRVGPLEELYALNLGLGLATSVRVQLGAFSASQFPQLVRKLKRLEWEPWVRADLPVDVRVRSTRSRLYHTKGIAERTRRALAEALGVPPLQALDPEAPAETPHTLVHVEAHDNAFVVSVDTSGEPLYRRGYRLATGKAPLRPDLARALVVASGWDRETPLVDPFCGAGTVLIEAALWASGRVLESGRDFAFQRMPNFDPAAATRALETLTRAAARRPALPPLLGSDRDEGVVVAAAENAARAGAPLALRFEAAALTNAPAFGRHAPLGGSARTLVSNPPYGLRVGDARTLRNLYQRLGTLCRELPAGSRVALLTPPKRERDTGLTFARAWESNHGGQHVVANVAQVRAEDS